MSLDDLAWELAYEEVFDWQVSDHWMGYPDWDDEVQEREAAERFYPICRDRAEHYKEVLEK